MLYRSYVNKDSDKHRPLAPPSEGPSLKLQALRERDAGMLGEKMGPHAIRPHALVLAYLADNDCGFGFGVKLHHMLPEAATVRIRLVAAVDLARPPLPCFFLPRC